VLVAEQKSKVLDRRVRGKEGPDGNYRTIVVTLNEPGKPEAWELAHYRDQKPAGEGDSADKAAQAKSHFSNVT
jgi:hypothetical protein